MTITTSHNLDAINAVQQCPRCGHNNLRIDEGVHITDAMIDTVPVFCVPGCVTERVIDGERYWSVQP